MTLTSERSLSENINNLKKKTVCLIIAVRNEEMLIEKFVSKAFEKLGNHPEYNLDLLFVEDGSKDNTLNILRNISAKEKKVKYISLINPFGQGVALALGIVRSDADATVTIDIDESHPLEIASEMIEKFLNGYDVVQGIRIEYKRDSLYRQMGSTIYFLLFSLVTGINLKKQNVHFRLMDRKARAIFISDQNWWYFLRTKFATADKIKTFYIPFKAPERTSGKSKFHFRRLFVFAFKSFLTLTSPVRFVALMLLSSILIFIFCFLNLWIAIIGLLLLIFILSSYILNRNKDYLR
jgi:glycosyltransferase involved in cell wall biosynthesis